MITVGDNSPSDENYSDQKTGYNEDQSSEGSSLETDSKTGYDEFVEARSSSEKSSLQTGSDPPTDAKQSDHSHRERRFNLVLYGVQESPEGTNR